MGVGINKNFLRNIELFAKKHEVEKIYVFLMSGKYKDESFYAPELNLDPFEIIDR